VYDCAVIGWLINVFLIPGMDRAADFRYKAGHIDYTIAWLLLTFLGVLGDQHLWARVTPPTLRGGRILLS